MVGLRPVRLIRCLIDEFERASGQQVHKTKTCWMPNRPMTKVEKQLLQSMWPDAAVVERAVVVGIPLGLGVESPHIVHKAESELQRRISLYHNHIFSFGMRIFVANVFLIPLLSCVNRVI